MQRLTNPNIVVPADNEGRYFRYLHAETGHVTTAATYSDWIEQSRAHRKANDLDIPIDLDAQMENQLCQQLPPEWCQRNAGDRSWASTRFSWSDVVNGMKAFARLFAGGFNFVSQAEADRRARICSNCYFNVNLAGACAACPKLADLVTGDVLRHKTAYDAKLKACAVCHCSLPAKVHFEMADIESVEAPELQNIYPDFCWVQKSSANYRSA